MKYLALVLFQFSVPLLPKMAKNATHPGLKMAFEEHLEEPHGPVKPFGNHLQEPGGYGTVCTFAQQLGETEATRLLEQTFNEEKLADQKLNTLALSTINAHAKA